MQKNTFVENLIKVMGTKVMSASEIAVAMRRRRMIQDAGPHLSARISLVLASAPSKDGKLFVAVSRGRYKVDTRRDREARQRKAFMALLDAWNWMDELSEEDSARVDLLMHSSEEERNAVLDHLLGPDDAVG